MLQIKKFDQLTKQEHAVIKKNLGELLKRRTIQYDGKEYWLGENRSPEPKESDLPDDAIFVYVFTRDEKSIMH